MDYAIAIQFAGAVIGSSIAVIYQGDEDSKTGLWGRFFIGLAIGFVSGPITISFYDLPTNKDYLLAATFVGGAFGHSTLEVAHKNKLIFKWLSGFKIKKR